MVRSFVALTMSACMVSSQAIGTPATVQTETLKGTIMDCREDMADPDDTELGKGNDKDFKDRLYGHPGVTPGDVQKGADAARPRAAHARDARSNGLTTRCTVSRLHVVHIHDSATHVG